MLFRKVLAAKYPKVSQASTLEKFGALSHRLPAMVIAFTFKITLKMLIHERILIKISRYFYILHFDPHSKHPKVSRASTLEKFGALAHQLPAMVIVITL